MGKVLHHCMGLLLFGLFMCCIQTEAMQPNCSTIAAKEKVGCVINTNATVCQLMGCCWNQGETNKTLRCYTKKGGSCMPYHGQVCRHSLNSTLSLYRHTPRFFDNKFGLLGTEQFLLTVTKVINDFVTEDEKCRYILLNMLCQYTLQPCYPNNKVIEYCREDCEAIFDECSGSLNQVIGAVKLLVKEQGIDFVHTGLPDCSRHKPYSYFEDKPDEICIKTGFFTMQPSCSTIAAKEKVGCVINTNATVCQLMGCCWNQGETNKTLRCYTKKGGSCMPYHGQVCRHSLNSTLSPYRHTPRFFDNKFGLLGTEQFLLTVTKVINDFVTKDEKCRYILLNMLCQYTLQPCYPNNKVIEYCREDCEAIFDECSGSLNQVIGAVKLLVKTQGIDFVHTGLPDCSRHKPYSYFEDKPDEICIKTGFFNYTEEGTNNRVEATPTDPPDGSKLEIIIPLVIVGILLILVVVIVFVLWHRRLKQRDAVDNAYAIAKKGSITMRDRLRAESLKSLDSRLLRLYDPNKLKQYRLDHVQYVKDLGEGFFGKVFQGRATGLLDNQPKKEIAVAVKALKDEPSKEQKDEFFREVTLMSILSHPNIVKLLAVSTEEEPYGMVFEFMSKGDLNQYLRGALPAETSLGSDQTAKVYLSQEDLVSISVQIASGMQYLAEMKFVHRDLAARNCLVGEDLVVKVGDFGMSRDIYTSEYYKMSKETLLPIRWLAPEAFLYGKFSLKSDVYAYGVVLWEIFTFGLQPYYGYTNKEVMDFIQKGIHLGKPDNCPDFMYAIMKDCWIREPEKRIEFTALSMRLKDPYHNYDVPPSSDSEDGLDGLEQVEATEPDMGNYDVPRSNATSNYDIPRATANEGTYDVPRSYEDLTDEKFDEGGEIPVSDTPV